MLCALSPVLMWCCLLLAGGVGATAGLVTGDFVLSFGSAHAFNSSGMASIVAVVRNNLDRPIPVTVRRAGADGGPGTVAPSAPVTTLSDERVHSRGGRCAITCPCRVAAYRGRVSGVRTRGLALELRLPLQTSRHVPGTGRHGSRAHGW